MEEPAFVTRLRGRAKSAMEQAHLEAARAGAERRDAATVVRETQAGDRAKKLLEKPEPVLKPRSARRTPRRLQEDHSPTPPAVQRTERQSYFASLKARVRGDVSNDNSLIREDFDRSAERG